MTSFDQQTLDFYQAEAPDYAASGAKGVSRHLDGFLDLLAPGARILELGCGSGRDAARMLERGFAVEATDGVAAMAVQAARRIGRPVRVMRFDELDVAAEFDAVVASASLLHVPRGELCAVLSKIFRALRPGGWHLASYKAGGTEGRDRLGRYFNYLSPEQAGEFYRDAGAWSPFEVESGMGGGYDGKRGPWIKVTARKAQ